MSASTATAAPAVLVPVYADRVREYTAVVGFGPITLAGAVPGCVTFTAGYGVLTAPITVCIEDQDNGLWLVGAVSFDPVANALTIESVEASSNGGDLVTFVGNPNTQVYVVTSASVLNQLLTSTPLGTSGWSAANGQLTYTQPDGQIVTLTGTIKSRITGISPARVSFAATSAPGYTLATLAAAESSAGGAATFSLLSDTTGGGLVLSGAALNLAATIPAGFYTAQIQVTDPNASNSPQVFTIDIVSVNTTAITNINLSSLTIPSGQASAVGGTLTVTGVNNPTATLSLTGANSSNFNINASNQIVSTSSLTPGPYPITVLATPPSPNLATPAAATGQALTVTGTGPDLLVLEITQDFYSTNAQFTVSVNGAQQGGTFSASALAGSELPDLFAFRGAWGASGVSVSVNLLNYNNSGTAAAPVNLRTIQVVDLVYNGAPQLQDNFPATLTASGAKAFPVTDTTYSKLFNLTAQSNAQITSIICSNTNFADNTPLGTVIGTLSVQGTNLSGTATFSIPDPTHDIYFKIQNGNQLVLIAALGVGQPQPLIEATLPGAGNSPYQQTLTFNVYAGSTGTGGTSGTQNISGIALVGVNNAPITQIEAGTQQYAQIGIVQANGTAGALADPITYALTAQTGPTSGAFSIGNYNELIVQTPPAAGTYKLTVEATCAAAANSPQSVLITLVVAAAGTISLNAVASSVVQGEQIMLSGSYTGLPPTFIGYDFNASGFFVPAYNLAIDTLNSAWSAICPAPVSIGTFTVRACKGNTGIASAASNSFTTTAYDSAMRLFFTPAAIMPGLTGFVVGTPYVSGGVGPFTYSLTSTNSGRFSVDPQSGSVGLKNAPDILTSPTTITLTVTGLDGKSVSHTYDIAYVMTSVGTFGQKAFYFHINASTQPVIYATVKNPESNPGTVSINNGNGVPAVSFLSPTPSGFNANYYLGIGNYGGNTVTEGSYPYLIRYTSSWYTGYTIQSAFMLDLIEPLAPYNYAFIPVANVNSAFPVGTVVGQVGASSLDNTASFGITGPGADYLAVAAFTGVVTVKNALPVGALTFQLAGSVTSGGYTSTSQTFTLNVAQGNILAPSTMTATVATNLTNLNPAIYKTSYGINDRFPAPLVAVTPVLPPGITGTPQWSLQQNNTTLASTAGSDPNAAVINGGHLFLSDRYEIDPSTGVVTAVHYLSAQQDVLTLTVFDGINTCTQSFTVSVSGVQGMTYHVGQGMSTTYTDGSGVEYITSAWGAHTGRYSGPIFAGETMLVYPNSDQNYYANDNGNGPQNTPKYNYDCHTGLAGPATWEGVTGGPMPRVGGTWLQWMGWNGVDNEGKGFWLWSGGDTVFKNFENTDSRCVSFNTNPTLQMNGAVGAAYRFNAQCYGNGTVINALIHRNDQGVECGDCSGNYVVQDCHIFDNGGCYQGSGATHNLYMGEGWQLLTSNVLTMRTFNGHTFKCRMQYGTHSHVRALDTERGQASNQFDMPNGGVHTHTNGVYHKGTQAQNPYALAMGEDMQYYTNPTNWTLNTSGCTYINNSYNNLGASAINMTGQVSQINGNYSKLTSSGDSFFGWGGNNITSEWHTTAGQGWTGTIPVPNVPVTTTNLTNLTAQPKLDLTSPVTPAYTARPGAFILPYDGETRQNYLGESFLGSDARDVPTGMGQVDIGFDDFHVSASGSPVGTVIAPNVSATGAPYFTGNPTQPDIRINPYGSGTTWSLLASASSYTVGSYPLATAGQFHINSTTGAISVGAALTPGTVYLIAPQASNNGYFTWDLVYVVADA